MNKRINMKRILEKLKASSVNLKFWRKKSGDSPDCPESGWDFEIRGEKKRLPIFRWIIILVPVILFLILGLYFLHFDLNFLVPSKSEDRKIAREKSPSSRAYNSYNGGLSGASFKVSENEIAIPKEFAKAKKQQEKEGDENPKLFLKFDYEDSLPARPDLTSNSSNSKEAIIVLENDDSGKKIFLKTSSKVSGNGFGNLSEEREQATTSKTFVYSPTIPQSNVQKPNLDATTKKYNRSDDSRCFSTKLDFCEGILPYDVVQLPEIPNIKHRTDLSSFLPYFKDMIASGCSSTARDFLCSVLEPECQPEGLSQRLPCKLNCKIIFEDCKNLIRETPPLASIFDCRKYPDPDERADCLNFSKGDCKEFRCADGSCIPSKWVCDGVGDCPGMTPGLDEINCGGCSRNEFRCTSDGKCVPLHWKCDGRTDCTDNSDESSCS